MTIKCFKLITGEEVISDVEIDQEGYRLSSPALVILQQNPDGRYGVGLAPFMTYAESIVMKPDSVVVEADVNSQLENEYRRIFGSGIVVASAGSLPK